MTSPRLEAMAKRAALPIRVEWIEEGGDAVFHIWRTQVSGQRGYFPWAFCGTAEVASRDYFDLISTLESAAPSSADTAADCSAPSLTPEGVR